MANVDKGHLKWRDNSQANGQDLRLRDDRGRRGKPQVEIYRPGSGPLRKSALGDEDNTATDDSHRGKPPENSRGGKHDDWKRNRRRHNHSSSDYLNKNCRPPYDDRRMLSQGGEVSKLSNQMEKVQITDDDKDGISFQVPDSLRGSLGDLKRSKRPEQAHYVPKPLAQAIADRDGVNQSSNAAGTVAGSAYADSGRKSETEEENWDNDFIYSQRDARRNDPHEKGNEAYSSRGSFNGGRRESDAAESASRPQQRYPGSRPGYRAAPGEDSRVPPWRAESPPPHLRKPDLREVRQASEPRSLCLDSSRARDTRSVEPAGRRGGGEKLQAKPPSGRRGSKDGILGPKYEMLPPRLKKKYLAENMGEEPMSYIGTTSEAPWDGSTVTFKGSASYHTHTLPLQHVPAHQWYQTLPSPRARGRGRMRPDEVDACMAARFSRSLTPDRPPVAGSAARVEHDGPARFPSPSPPPACDPGPRLRAEDPARTPRMQSAGNSCGASTDNGEAFKRPATPPKPASASASASASVPEPEPQESSEAVDSVRELSPVILDWSEEVELTERLEAAMSDAMTRSSSLVSVHDKGPSLSAPGASSKKRRKRRRKERNKVDDRSTSRERSAREGSRDRGPRAPPQPARSWRCSQDREAVPPSREHSRDRGRYAEGRPRGPGSGHAGEEPRKGDGAREQSRDRGKRRRSRDRRHRRASRDGKPDPPGSGHVAGIIVIHPQKPPAPEASVSGPPFQGHPHEAGPAMRQPPQRVLYDPNNPSKPIVVSSGNTRSAAPLHPRDGESNLAGSPPTGFPPHAGYAPQAGEVDQFSNSRPSWHPHQLPEGFHQPHNSLLLLELERVDARLQWLMANGGILHQWKTIASIREYLQGVLVNLLLTDLKFCQQQSVDQVMWKLLFYNIIEHLRKRLAEEDSPERKDQYKSVMLSIIEEGTAYLESLLTLLEQRYHERLALYHSPQHVAAPPPKTPYTSVVLVAAQKILLFLGDLARYREQVNETSSFGKSRQFYIKAHQLNPKNGRPYNQLAILALYARRKLDAVYYYMRSLMASNPFFSARESLLSLFDESRKKYEQAERKRREEREAKQRERMQEKEGAGLRRELWVHPEGGRRLHITTSTLQEQRRRDLASEEEELAQLSSVEVNKRFVTSYLNVQGKLFTKIGMETFQEAAVQMLREFRALLQHSPVPLNSNRFLQLLALNMFAVENTQPKESLEADYRSAVQESALVVSLQMFNLILEKCVSLLKENMARSDCTGLQLVASEDLRLLLPAVKVWCDWLVCHSAVWNPPPSCQDYRVGPPGDAWTRMASFVNLLEKLDHDIRLEEAPREGYEMVRLPEDSTLSGFTPLMPICHEPVYVKNDVDMEEACIALRVRSIVFFGTVWLCGEDPPVLKLHKFDNGLSEYVSIVASSGQCSLSSPPEEQSDSELVLESFSEDELAEAETQKAPGATEQRPASSEIQSLLSRKEELEKRQEHQERHRQRVQAILRETVVIVEIEVRPHYLVPDTNCFIDYLPLLQKVSQATSSLQQPLYTLMVPLVVLKELEGLARGGRDRDVLPLAPVEPAHAARVATGARQALAFLRSRQAGVRCVTSRGTVLAPAGITMEEDTEPGQGNDDRVLATCLSLCRCPEQESEPGEPRRLLRDVVLLTEDRNLRVKALARHVPVREVPDFARWAGLG
ncbi:telomerase-binding protein EST1A [Bacillus rossius redtenbacheri]|uniref:telomerase-binding protein EST1A n=1 Tax=Bacillus rossius redtenbacheri TaxID=93214 RepID=UPI002FDCFD3E